ncbi:MAG TPA: hypothetical protein VEH27_05725 [Methylomirabilota bacterium]|nr:hypothetical protein [Methylomirabilota bacterium]
MPIAKKVTKAARATARTLKAPLRKVARRAETMLTAAEERMERSRNQRPEEKVAKTRTQRKTVLKKGSDRELVKAFGKKTATRRA